MTAIDWNKKEAPRKAFGEALAALGEAYPRLLVLDADVGTSTMSSIFQKKYPDRFLQMGIAEANMLGVAAGLAAVGFTPFRYYFCGLYEQARAGPNSIFRSRTLG
jgi:transketolase